MSDFKMGPLPDEDLEETVDGVVSRMREQIETGSLAGLDKLSPAEVAQIEEWGAERRRELDAEPRRGLRRPETAPLSAGWQCPNCGRAHSPDVPTCPEEPRGGSLRERLKSASNG
jgi:hypothetical protein